MMKDFIILNSDLETLLEVAKLSPVYFLGRLNSRGCVKGLNQNAKKLACVLLFICSTHNPRGHFQVVGEHSQIMFSYLREREGWAQFTKCTLLFGGGGAAIVEMGRPRLHDGVTLPPTS